MPYPESFLRVPLWIVFGDIFLTQGSALTSISDGGTWFGCLVTMGTISGVVVCFSWIFAKSTVKSSKVLRILTWVELNTIFRLWTFKRTLVFNEFSLLVVGFWQLTLGSSIGSTSHEFGHWWVPVLLDTNISSASYRAWIPVHEQSESICERLTPTWGFHLVCASH